MKGMILGDTEVRWILSGKKRAHATVMADVPPYLWGLLNPARPMRIASSNDPKRVGLWRWTKTCDPLSEEIHLARPPLGEAGDRVWIREGWAPNPENPSEAIYRADRPPEDRSVVWKPAATLPRALARPMVLRLSSAQPMILNRVPMDTIREIGCTDEENENIAQFHLHSYIKIKYGGEKYRHLGYTPWVWVYRFNVEGG